MSHRRRRKPEQYKTIDADCASQVFEMHKEYPQLGHDGLLKVLADAGFRIDPDELTDFLDENDIHAERWESEWGYIPGRFRIRPLIAAYIDGKD